MPEQDVDADRDTVRHLRDECLVETADIDGDERGLTLVQEGRECSTLTGWNATAALLRRSTQALVGLPRSTTMRVSRA